MPPICILACLLCLLFLFFDFFLFSFFSCDSSSAAEGVGRGCRLFKEVVAIVDVAVFSFVTVGSVVVVYQSHCGCFSRCGPWAEMKIQ